MKPILNYDIIENRLKTNIMNYAHKLGSYVLESKDQASKEESLRELLEPFKNFTHVTIRGKEFKVVQKFTSDMKFIYEVYGLSTASSHYSCIYCETNLQEAWQPGDETKRIPINRTLAEARRVVEQNLKKQDKNEKKGYIHAPLCHIDFNMIVLDTLHLFLRMSDRLIDALLLILNTHDAKPLNTNLDMRPALGKFLGILKNECKITNPYYLKNKEFRLRTLNGSERERIFIYFSNQQSSLVATYPAIEKMGEFEKVFKGFWLLFCKIKNYKPEYKDMVSPALPTAALAVSSASIAVSSASIAMSSASFASLPTAVS